MVWMIVILILPLLASDDQDLSKHNPPYWVWQGKFSSLVWITSHMLVGFLDGTMKSMVGLDVVKK